MIERIHPDEGPEGLMLDVANAHDDYFRWRVAAACVKVAKELLDVDMDVAEKQTFTDYKLANRAIWDWTSVGEIMARYLAVGHGVDLRVGDDDLVAAVRQSWTSVAIGIPNQE